MKKINVTGKLLSEWKLADYFRQLSIVIVGIIVTFAASNAVSDYAEKKEITDALQLVKDELELNKQEMQRISDRIRLEQEACDYVLRYRDCLEKASEDTLKMYRNIPFQIRAFVYTKDAVELLKTSSLFQKIRPKALALRITRAYNNLETTAMLVKWFYDGKSAYTGRLLYNGIFDFYNKEQYNSVRNYWENFLSTHEGRNVCNYVVNNFVSFSPFQDRVNNLEETIRLLEKNYGLK